MSNLLNSLLNSANALRAYDQVLQVTQNNVTNASTPGFVKHRQTLLAMPFEAQKSFLVTLAARYGKIIGAVAGITILFGLGRGIAVGVLGNLGSAYGLTFLASIVLAVFVAAIGGRFIGPTAAKMAEAATREEVVRLAGRIRGYGRFDTGGMLALVALMVAMRAGY